MDVQDALRGGVLGTLIQGRTFADQVGSPSLETEIQDVTDSDSEQEVTSASTCMGDIANVAENVFSGNMSGYTLKCRYLFYNIMRIY